MTDDPNYLSFVVGGLFSAEAKGLLAVCLLTLVVMLVVGLIAWGAKGPGRSLIVSLLLYVVGK